MWGVCEEASWKKEEHRSQRNERTWHMLMVERVRGGCQLKTVGRKGVRTTGHVNQGSPEKQNP